MAASNFAKGMVIGLQVGAASAKPPVLAELTVTENGVYDNPVIEGERSITWDGVAGDRVTVKSGEEMMYTKLSDKILSVEDLLGGTIVTNQEREYILDSTTVFELGDVILGTELVVVAPKANATLPLGSETITFPEAGIYFFGVAPAFYVTSFTLASAPSTPADGWNKVTVNVPTGVELNIAYGDTPPEDTTKLWVKTAEPNGVSIGKGKHGGVLTEQMPEPQGDSGSAKIGSKIYMFCGRSATSGNTNIATCFDAETETAVLIPSTPISTVSPRAVPFGKKIYLFGGMNSRAIYIFDSQTMAYERLSTDMTGDMGASACGIVGDKVYFLGGCTGNVNSPKNGIYRFDITTNEYNVMDITLRSTTSHPASVTVGNKIYVFGGIYNGYNQSRSYAYCFDAETETLVNIKNLPKSLGCAGCVEIDGYIYIIGGLGFSGSSSYNLDTVYRYDIENDEYILTELTISKPKGEMACAEVNGKIYLLGGKLLSNGSYNHQEIEMLTIVPQVKEGFLHLETKDGATEVTAVSSDALTVIAPVSVAYLGNSVGVGESVEACVYKDGEWAPI